MYANIYQKLFVLWPIVQFGVLSNDDDVTKWNYNEGGADWGGTCASGVRQSPINLSMGKSQILPLPRIYFGNYNVQLTRPLTLHNNGHTVEMEVSTSLNGYKPFIMGGLLRGLYIAEGVHFHWGSPHSRGSEHLINRKRFDAEMHIVHRNSRYATIAEAKKYSDGLAVLAIMFKVVNSADRVSPALRKIFTALPKVVKYKSDVNLPGSIALGQLLGDLNTHDFYTYHGSLTTPNCDETVIWTVFAHPLPVPRSDLSKLWRIKDHDGHFIENNYRKTQSLKNHHVFYRSPQALG